MKTPLRNSLEVHLRRLCEKRDLLLNQANKCHPSSEDYRVLTEKLVDISDDISFLRIKLKKLEIKQ